MKMRSVSQPGRSPAAGLISFFICAFLAVCPGSTAAKTFCFDLQYYPQLENLAHYDFTVLDPHTDADLSIAHRAGKKVFAYISVGEVGADAWYRDEAFSLVPVISVNPDWGSSIMEIRDPDWAQFVINRLAALAVAKGFDGFFLDTVDVIYDMAQTDPGAAQGYFDAMANLINGLKRTYPLQEIIPNGGLDIYGQVKNSISGVLVESMFQTHGGEAQDPESTFWLNEELAPVKNDGKPIYVIDYVEPWNTALAWTTAQRIQQQGYNALVMASLDGNVLASLSSTGTPVPPPVEPPVIVAPPQSISVPAGQSVTFKVEATGHDLTYQWQWKGNNITGAVGPTYQLTGVKATWAGAYTVVVKNAGGSVTAGPAVLSIIKKKNRR